MGRIHQMDFCQILAGSTDLHAKNMSVQLLPDGTYRFAPMYDVASFVPYAPLHELSFSYQVDGSADFVDLCDEARWERYAKRLGLDEHRIVAEFRRLRAFVPKRLLVRFADNIDGPIGDMMAKSLKTFWERTIHCERKLDGNE